MDEQKTDSNVATDQTQTTDQTTEVGAAQNTQDFVGQQAAQGYEQYQGAAQQGYTQEQYYAQPSYAQPQGQAYGNYAPTYQQPYATQAENPYQMTSGEKAYTIILSVFFSFIVPITMWFCWRNVAPAKAKQALIWGLVTCVILVVVWILICVLLMGLVITAGGAISMM